MAQYKKPKIKETKTKSVKGLTIQDIIGMTTKELNSYSIPSIRQITSRLVSAMNKRIRYLGKSEVGRMSPTYKKYEKSGFYSIKNKSGDALTQLFKSLQTSLSSPYTTATGFKELRKDLYDRLEIDFNELSKDDYYNEVSKILGHEFKGRLSKSDRVLLEKQGVTLKDLRKMSKDLAIETEKKFWDVFHHYEEYDKDFQNWSKGQSDEVINYMANNIDFKNIKLGELKTKLEDKYKTLKQQTKTGKREDEFFETKGDKSR